MAPNDVPVTRTNPAARGVGSLLAALLVLAPTDASAASWWCTLFPWLPVCGAPAASCGTVATEVRGFGSNPGNLKMCMYVPHDLGASRPLVVALHGCRQQASDYDDEPGWIEFADRYRFALLLPEQQQANNSSRCFNWFDPADSTRDHGEALSIRQMIEAMKVSAGVDPDKIYVTGLSAGGAMAAVMLAVYPEVFAGGAIIAGVPYRCANSALDAVTQCGVGLTGQLTQMKDLTPAEWGSLVRAASGYGGPFPPVSIWQGTADTTVNPQDQRELVDQWTDVLGIDEIPDVEDTIGAGHPHRLYLDGDGKALVETVLVNGMGHGTPIAPGNGDDRCGKVAPFILDVGLCSTFYISKFWGLDAQ